MGLVLGNPLPAQARPFRISKVYLECLSNSIATRRIFEIDRRQRSAGVGSLLCPALPNMANGDPRSHSFCDIQQLRGVEVGHRGSLRR